MRTRKEKREREEGKNYFFEFLKIQKHFFKGIMDKLKNVKIQGTEAISRMNATCFCSWSY